MRSIKQPCPFAVRYALQFVTLLLETGARYGTIRRLQWKNIDFENRSLTLGKDKTKAGSGRTIPLSPRALETLRFWAEQFPSRSHEHFVFPHERYGAAGRDAFFGFSAAKVYDSDVTRPTGAIKVGWEQARKRAGLRAVRIHDLRHTAVSRMIAAKIPMPIIARIVGWSAGTMAKMAARYGHFTLDEMREAMGAISRPSDGISTGYPKKSPKLDDMDSDRIQ